MARNVFSLDPVEFEAQRGLGAVPQAPEQSPVDPLARIEDVARKHGVGANTLMAFATEDGDVSDIEATVARADQRAARLAELRASGMTQREALTELAGGDIKRARLIGQKANDIQLQFYPETLDRAHAKQLGQRAARGLTEIVAAFPQGMAVSGANVDRTQTEEAAEFRDQRIEEIAAMEARLLDDDLTPSERSFIAQNISDMKKGVRELDRRANAEVVVAEDRPGYEAGERIREASRDTFGTPDPRDESFSGALAEGAGNMVGFVATAIGGGLIGGGPGATMATAAAGASLNQASIYKEARAAGLTPEEAEDAAQIGMILGTTEALPIVHALRYLPKNVRDAVSRRVVRRIASIAVSAGEEAAQEALMGMANNLIAKNYYDPERGVMDDVGQQALIGAILGGAVNVTGQAITPGREASLPFDTEQRGGGTPRETPGDARAPGEAPLPGGAGAPRGGAAAGPLEAAVAGAPRPPEPEPEQPEDPLYPDFKAGQELKLKDPDGKVFDAVFLGEKRDAQGNTMLNVRVGAEAFELTPQEFNAAFWGEEAQEAEAERAERPDAVDSEYPQDFENVLSEVEARIYARTGEYLTPEAQRAMGSDVMAILQAQEIDPVSPEDFAAELNAIVDEWAPSSDTKRNADRQADKVVEGKAEEVEPEFAALPAPDEGFNQAGDMTRRDGSPFPDQRSAARAIRSRGLDASAYEIVALDDGFVVRPKPETANDTGPDEAPVERDDADDLLDGAFDAEFGAAEDDAAVPRDEPQQGADVSLPVAADGQDGGDGTDDGGAGDAVVGDDPDFVLPGADGAGRGTGSVDPVALRKAQRALKKAVMARERALAEPGADAAELVDSVRSAAADLEALIGRDAAQEYWSQLDRVGQQRYPDVRLPATVEATESTDTPREQGAPETADEGSRESPQTKRLRVMAGSMRKSKDIDLGENRGTFRQAEVQIDAAADLIDAGQTDAGLDMLRNASRDLFRGWQAHAEVLDEIIDELGGGTPATPVPTAEQMDAAASETDPNPSEAQKEAENYKTGKESWHGLRLSFENRKGTERSGVGPDGETWSVEMPAHYGRILKTEGADGDHVDFYMGDHPDSETVWIIDQKDAETGLFDEHKVMLGFKNKRKALTTHREAFNDGKGKDRQGGVTEMTVDQLKAWLKDGDQSRPAASTGQEASGRGGKQKDFGEQIGGVRKDSAKKWRDDLSGDLDIASGTLSDAIPIPDYAALAADGVPMENLAIVAHIRARIRRKPASSWQVDSWAEEVREARGQIASLVNGGVTAEQFLEESFLYSPFKQAIPVMAKLPPDLLKDAGETSVVQAQDGEAKVWVVIPPGGSIRRDYDRENKRWVLDQTAWDEIQPERMAEYLAERLRAAADRRAARRAAAGNKPIEFQPRGPRGKPPFHLYITKPRILPVPGLEGVKFATGDLARQYVEENREELEDRVRQFWAGPNERLTEARERKGPPRRSGPATEEMFLEELGFRGVAFGNWLTAKDRQSFMDRTYDAMVDLAGILGVPLKTLSLNGRLGIGFGTHGKGGKGHWAAVYVQSSVRGSSEDQVIALTKNYGAGSLAHEWFHAVDNFMAREDSDAGGLTYAITKENAKYRRDYMSDRFPGRDTYPGGLGDETTEAFRRLRNALVNSDWRRRMEKFDRYKGKPYYATVIEMAARSFERMVVQRLHERDMVNDFLANPDLDDDAYLTPAEIRRTGIGAAFDAVLDRVSAHLAIEGQTAPDMPPVIESRVNKAPGVGFEWESPEGWREITDYDPKLRHFMVSDKATGKSRLIDEDKIEDLIEGDAHRMTPEYREAERLKQEQEERNQAANEERESALSPIKKLRGESREDWRGIVQAFAAATGKSAATVENRLDKSFRWEGSERMGGTWLAPRGAMIVYQVRNGTSSWIYEDAMTKVGVEFYQWYKAEWDRQLAAKEAAEAAAKQRDEADGITDDADADVLLDAALDDEFGQNEQNGQNVQNDELTPDEEAHLFGKDRPDPKDFGLTRDNPGGGWLEAKQRRAEEEMKTGETGLAANGFRGAQTAGMGADGASMFLPTDWLAGLKGVNGETREPGNSKYDALRGAVDEAGFDPEQKGNRVVVAVNHKGQAFIMEGNTRVAVARDTGVPRVKAEVRYWNGGELTDGPASPSAIAAMANKSSDQDLSATIDDPAATASPGPRSAGQAAASAAQNTAEGVKNVVDGLNALFGGDDPTTLSMGLVFNKETYEKAKPMFIAAARAFGRAGQDIKEMVSALVKGLRANGLDRTAQENMRPYLTQFIRDVQSGEIDVWAEDVRDTEDNDPEKVAQAFHEAFKSGDSFATIVQARKRAGEVLGRKIEEADYLWVEEAIESAVVRRARELATEKGKTPQERFTALMDLYNAQPRLMERTPDKVLNQAYSTPAPLAYVASRLAGIGPQTRVIEPTAGNGMLLLEANPAVTQANELQTGRAAALRANIPGLIVSESDATALDAQKFDVLIANPPFGKVTDQDVMQRKEWPLGPRTTKDVDQAIAWRFLEAMPDDGRAVLILGGVKKQLQGEARTAAYQERGKLIFYKLLYDTYNVVDHFTVAGELYQRQGAAWPVDVIVIDGRAPSQRDLPMKQAPAVLQSWEEVGAKLQNAPDMDTTGRGSDAGAGTDSDNDAGADAGGISRPTDGEAQQGDPAGTGGGRGGSGGSGSVGGSGAGGRRSGDGEPVGGAERPGDATDDAGRDDLADQPGPAQAGGQEGAGGLGAAPDGAGANAVPRARVKRDNQEAETEFQVQYEPASNARFAVGTLVPKAMQDAMRAALSDIAARRGDIDVFVARELGYSLDELLGTETKDGYFSAEQVDALAMAIDNVDQGKGFIIGDMTGVGKGRFVAAMLRYADRKGRMPVFVTQKPNLYSDMIRDLRDIGYDKKKILGQIMATNQGLASLEVSGPDDLFQGMTPAELKKALSGLSRGKLPAGKKFLFTTYSQMQTVKGELPRRATALMDAARKGNVMVVMDESHEAGGTADSARQPKREPGAPARNRAEYFRDLVEAANGVVYSSATYAKNPTVMSLYSATNLSLTVENIDDLGPAIEKGGVPLQQVVANLITADGQYARRERSFEGVDFIGPGHPDFHYYAANEGHAKEFADVVGELGRFDVDTMEGIRATFIQTIQAEGLLGGKDGAVGVENASSASFGSTLHNLVNQFLLALKIDEAVADAIATWKAGEKPVLTLMNVNSAIIGEAVAASNASVGQEFDLPFTVIVDRYLERLRQVKVETADGEVKQIRLSDADLGPAAVAEFEALRRKIEAMPLDGMTGSPVDTILDKLRDAGMKVGEITGRNLVIEGGVLQSRQGGPKHNRALMNRFNRGELDALILSASGSTGFSLHAQDPAKFDNDGKRRHMIVLQAHADINVFMQTLGRVHRTGQIVPPRYTLAASDLAMERRPAAVLMKKMNSLNANTTAGKRSATSLDVVDMINVVGDAVVTEYLRGDEVLADQLGLGSKIADSKGGVIADIAKQATGRFAYIPPDEVELHYDALEEAFRSKLAELDAAGTNPLEAKTMDFAARVLSETVIQKGRGTGSALDQDLVLQRVSVRRLGNPYPTARVKELVEQGLEGMTPGQWRDAMASRLQAEFPTYQAGLQEKLERRRAALEDAKRAQEDAQEKYQIAIKASDAAREAAKRDDATEEDQEAAKAAAKAEAAAKAHAGKMATAVRSANVAVEQSETAVQNQKAALYNVIQAANGMTPGQSVNVKFSDADPLVGVVIATDTSRMKGNPTAAGRITVRIAVADAQREVQFPLSRIMNQDSGLSVTQSYPGFDPYPFFDAGHSESRETRQIATGNLIAAFTKFQDNPGQVIFYTTEDGTVRPGMLMGKKFDLSEELGARDVTLDVDQAIQFVSEGDAGVASRVLKDSQKILSISKQDGGDYHISMPANRAGAYALLKAAVDRIVAFRKNTKAKTHRWSGTIPSHELGNVLRAYTDNLGTEWIADAHKDEARRITGEVIPTLEGDDDAGTTRRAQGSKARVRPAMAEVTAQIETAVREEMERVVGPTDRLHLMTTPEPFRATDMFGNDLDAYALYESGVVASEAVILLALNVENPLASFNHEVIHFFADPTMWRNANERGLFTKSEWGLLVRHSRRYPEIWDFVRSNYSNSPLSEQQEEAVAELYSRYHAGMLSPPSRVTRLLDMIGAVMRGLGLGLRRSGVTTAEGLLDAIRAGAMKQRMRDNEGRFSTHRIVKRRAQFRRDFPRPGRQHWRRSKDFFNDLLTDAMRGQAGLLSLVPGRALFTELGKKIDAPAVYQRLKEEMDALRNSWHARTDKVVQSWMKLRRSNTEANETLMDLMHRSTLAGVDPSEPFAQEERLEAAEAFVQRFGPDHERAAWANRIIAANAVRLEAYNELRELWDRLPAEFQAMYRTVRREYSSMADDFESAVVENIQTATRIAVKRAERNHRKVLRRIEDEGMSPEDAAEAVAEAEQRLQQARKRAGWATRARVGELRARFEANRLKGPYFPLARFGDFYVTLRDARGAVVSFSLFESARRQREAINELRREYPDHTVSHGVMSEAKDISKEVDPAFVADVQDLLAGSDAAGELMDAVWQRWLETLPDYSIRTSRIHRKGRRGFTRDALRAFSSHMFHGSHQLARLRFGLQMQDTLDDADEQADATDTPERTMLAVNEMRKRHEFTMAPTGSPLSARATSLAFVWYLGATPAAGFVNLSQTTVVGIPILKAGFRDHSVARISRELLRAGADFLRDVSPESYADTLSDDEKRAMDEAYRRGTVDKTQAHELAAVAETGIEYSGFREKWMKRISFFFHHAERANREITFLASYRLARDAGMQHEAAIDRAADLTWKTHFDYQNTARPRIMQNDWMKVLTVFRQFTVNMLWRLFRDTHQALHGATPAERREARTQLIGITLSMMAHAGITGVWGWGLLMTLLSMFFPGDDDDMEARIQDSLLVEGEDMGSTAWNFAMGMALKGVPGHALGISLSERIGMPDLWFRGSNRDLEGADLYNHWVGELLGPVAGIVESMVRAGTYAFGYNDWWKAFEAATPKAINDVSQAGRYWWQGVTTANGDMILEDVSPYQAIVQAIGFTPAQVAERYDANSRMMNAERRIKRERREITRALGDAIRNGRRIPDRVMDRMYDFNARFPEYPITPSTVNRSLAQRDRRDDRREFGVSLDPKLNDRIRGNEAQLLYQ